MDDATEDFDAADLADAILGTGEPEPVAAATPLRPPDPRGKNLGWVLLFALFVATSVAISLAVQLDSDATPVEPPPCGGLFTTDECCDVEPWPEPQPRGLFDAEAEFAERRDPRCSPGVRPGG